MIEISLEKIQAPPDAAFTCARCGDCCRSGLAVILSEREARDITALYPGEGIVIEQHFGDDGVTRVLATKDDGSCVLLDGNDCKAHRDHGELAKPSACLGFPYSLFRRESDVYLHLSRVCPTVYAGKGAAGSELAAAALTYGSAPRPTGGGAEVRTSSTQTISWGKYLDFEERLLSLLADERWSLDDAMGGGLILLRRFVSGNDGPDIDPINLVMAWIADRKPSFPMYKYIMASIVTAIERPPFPATGMTERVRRKLADITRFKNVLFWSGLLDLRTARMKVEMRRMYGIRWPRRHTPDLSPVRSLLSSHLRRKILLEAPDIEWGYHLLMGAYAAVKFYARASSASFERERLIPSDLQTGVRVVEDNLLLHRTLAGKPLDRAFVTSLFRRFLFHRSYPGSIVCM